MLSIAIIASLKILFIYVAMKDGMILFWLRRLFDWMVEPLPVNVFLWIRKPLYDCLTCMSSVWGIVFTLNIAAFTLQYLTLLFSIGGINYLIDMYCSDKEEKLNNPRDDALMINDGEETKTTQIENNGEEVKT